MTRPVVTPPVGEPLTAETARLLLPGDVLECLIPREGSISKGEYRFDRPNFTRTGLYLEGDGREWSSERFTFVSRPVVTQSPDEGLKPCPFCGAVCHNVAWPRELEGRVVAKIECFTDNCYATVTADSRSEAIVSWNRRPVPVEQGGEDTMWCDVCEGSGKIVDEARTHGANQHSACQMSCEDCDGSGRVPVQSDAPAEQGGELRRAVEKLEWRRNARELGATKEALDCTTQNNREAYKAHVLESATVVVDYDALCIALAALQAAPDPFAAEDECLSAAPANPVCPKCKGHGGTRQFGPATIGDRP